MSFLKIITTSLILISMGCSYVPLTPNEVDNSEEILKILESKVRAAEIIPSFDWENKTVLRPGINITTIDFIGITDKNMIDKISHVSDDVKKIKKSKISLRFFRDRIKKVMPDGSVVNESVDLITAHMSQ